MAIHIKNQKLRRVLFFFPLQLLFVVVKKNLLLVVFWLLLFSIVTQNALASYGIPFLFLSPEYLDEVNFWSYFITGFACGGFIMGFNITSYIMNSFRFPFIATLRHPFFKFCLNNCIIPVIFIIVYIINIYQFQIKEQFENIWNVIFDITGFLLGNIIFIVLALGYFHKLNKDIFKMFGVKTHDPNKRPARSSRAAGTSNIRRKNKRDWHVETYLSGFNSIRLARGYQHYKKEMLIRVFKQNHYIAAFFEVFAILSLIILGLFREIPVFEIPAGASLFLLFTMYIMITSALYSWFRGWANLIFVALLLTINYAYTWDLFDSETRAYGLNYKIEKSEFSYKRLIDDDSKKKMKQDDIAYTIEILNKWRLKNSTSSIRKKEKPKLVIINTSGGGLRSTLWTFQALTYADSVLDGELLKHTFLMAGSSGGLIGAAYLRELYLEKQQGKISSYYDDRLLNDVSKDILNPMAFSIATTDMFFRFQRFKDGKFSYAKDRAYAFESKLNENTNHILDKRLSDYREPEANALIPMMIMAPTIINDGRKLFISPQPVSYLTQNSIRGTISINPLIEGIEFSRFFEKQGADNLEFTSALRMNATFPYIMPLTSLPSEPEIEVFDSGMRDNFGTETTLRFLFTFRNWINSNTSGVIIVQLRDKHKQTEIKESTTKTLMQHISMPLGSFYGNLFSVQDYSQHQQIQYASLWFDGKIDFVDFEMRNEKNNKVSLSWHLTNKEKKNIMESINLPQNQESVRRLKELIQ
jgi:hypothetical protein